MAVCSILSSFAASAVVVDWTVVGDPGNPGDPDSNTAQCGPTFDQPCGSVGYTYEIGTYEVTNAQYAQFLNAVAAVDDPFALYSALMGAPGGGITREEAGGSYSYVAQGGREAWPVNYVTFFDALRFANWLDGGQGAASTETGSYTLLGGTPTPSNAATITRNPEAVIVVPNDDEWYKAAYYDPAINTFFDYPAGSDTPTTCALPSATPNTANCDSSEFTGVGGYTGSASPHGSFDQGGNITEWNETQLSTPGARAIRGGDYATGASGLHASARGSTPATTDSNVLGFRVANLPEPSRDAPLVAGALALALCSFTCRRAPGRAPESGRAIGPEHVGDVYSHGEQLCGTDLRGST